MIEAKPLEDRISVRHQLTPEDMAAAAEHGFHSVINNRPDGEESGQPTSAELEAAAQEAGLEYRHLPMTPGDLNPALRAQFASALEAMPGPVLAFCRTGTRSTMLWSCARAGDLGVDGVLEKAGEAGYDLQQMRPVLTDLAG